MRYNPKFSLKTLSLFLSLVFLFTLSAKSTQAVPSDFNYKTADPYIAFAEQLDGDQAFSFVEKLVSEPFEGRQSGTRGADRSAEWIAQVFQMYGLVPGGSEQESYFQPFEVPVFEIQRPCHLKMIQPNTTEFQYRNDFAVSPYSGSGKVSAEAVFTGYAIEDQTARYNDFDGVDLNGKIALILRKSPKFTSFTEESQYFYNKILRATKHGAKAVLFADIPDEKYPYSLDMKAARGYDMGIPVFFISPSTAEKLFRHSGMDFTEAVQLIEQNRKSNSIALNCLLEMETTLHFSNQDTSNVIGYLPSRTFSEESVLIVAHYDHLGVDWIDGSYYHGANDNASGVGTLIEIARTLTHQCFTSDVNIVFIAFSGEEEGLLGSFHYVQNPLFPLDKIRAVYNMDMVGTGTGELIAGTSESAYPYLYETLKSSAKDLSINVTFSENMLNAGSDHFPFHQKKIPNVFFFRRNPTGIGGYHTPEDTLDTVDPKNLQETGRIIILSLMELTEPLFMLVQSRDWHQEGYQKPYLRLYGLGNYSFRVLINEQNINPHKNARFFAIIPLKDGHNLVHAQIYNEDKLVYEKMYSIQTNIQKELAADFNDDRRVDLHDLRYLSQHFGQRITGFDEWIVCDLNMDGIINSEDVMIFQKYLGYRVIDG